MRASDFSDISPQVTETNQVYCFAILDSDGSIPSSSIILAHEDGTLESVRQYLPLMVLYGMLFVSIWLDT